MQQAVSPTPHPSVKQLQEAAGQVDSIVLGKSRQVRLALTCLLAGGHLLIEDIPGVGKTTLAQTLARVMGLDYQRIQFTSDLLPADIIGAAIFERDTSTFRFHPGPLFAQLVLADEVNRATPKTQSALLEAMEERQATVDGETRALPEPFFVIATQNPNYQIGTFPLPESQLDRFLMCLDLGYPNRAAERELLKGRDRREALGQLQPALQLAQLQTLQQAVQAVHASDALLDYIQALVDHSRQAPEFASGLSPRGALALLRAARAWALLAGRNHVLPEDVQAILPGVTRHRLQASSDTENRHTTDTPSLLLKAVPVP
ncbi:MAG TPA: AAA family ATPase [Gammaproteobacteria bacterium]|nr:AAA family ATPase [Gammaproteobacteria bacterium]